MASQTGRAGDMWAQSRIKVKPRCRFPKQRFQRYLQSKQTKNKLSFSAEGLSKLLSIGVQEALCTLTHPTRCLTDTHPHTDTHDPIQIHVPKHTQRRPTQIYHPPHTSQPRNPPRSWGNAEGPAAARAPPPRSLFLTPPSWRRPSACAAAASRGAGPFHSRPRACPETGCGR